MKCLPIIKTYYEEDLIQSGYFALIEAIERYSPDKGMKFVTYLDYPLQTCFNEVLEQRTSKDKKNPLHKALSLDMPAGSNTEDITLQDMIIDNMSQEDYRLIEDEDFWKDVHDLLEKAINNSMEYDTMNLFMAMLDYNCGFTEACRIIGVSEENKIGLRGCYNNGLRSIRKYIMGRGKKKYKELGLDEYLSIGLRSTGLTSFKNSIFTSSTERAAIKLADAEVWSRKIIQMFG